MSFVEPVKIAVVGAGKVGSSFAYAALLRGLASELVLIDTDNARAEGEAMDLQHVLPAPNGAELLSPPRSGGKSRMINEPRRGDTGVASTRFITMVRRHR